MDDAIKLIQNLGFPTAVCLAVGAFLWRLMVWLKPRADKIIDAHLGLVTTLATEQRKHNEALTQIAVTQQQQASLLMKIENKMQEKT